MFDGRASPGDTQRAREGQARLLRPTSSRSASLQSDPETSSGSEASEPEAATRKLTVPLWGALLGMAAAAVASCGATLALSSAGRAASTTGMGGSQDDNALDLETERGGCVPGAHNFRDISTFDSGAQNSVYEAFRLVNHARRQCPNGGLPSIPFGKTAFLRAQDHCHSVRVRQKFSRSCGSETYRLDFSVSCREGNGTSFTVQVNRDRQSEVWVLLESNPRVCELSMGSAASPRTMPLDSKETIAVADFAAYELGYAMRSRGCLPNGSNGFNVSRVVSATATVVDGVAWKLLLELDGAGAVPRQARLTVLDRCTEGTACIRQLSVPGGDACRAFSATAGGRRLLAGSGGAGAGRGVSGVLAAGGGAADPTNILDAHREFLRRPRRLQEGGRKPLTLRHIRDGPIQYSLDLTAHECLVHVPPVNQGHCGSCYAATAAQMIGIRRCILDKKEKTGRRLHGPLDAAAPVQNRSLRSLSALPAPPRALEDVPCHDDATWRVFGKGRSFDCAWFAAHDAGCRKYPDHGQLSHCSATCGTCGAGDLTRTREDAWWQYMVALNDVATCARDSDGHIRGCDGGGPEDVWNHWMKDLGRDLWLHGVKCMPNKLKCHEAPDGVTNPLLGGLACKDFDRYPEWQRPCPCLPTALKSAPPQCSAGAPAAGCRHEVPPAFVIVKSVAHGLSPRDAAENMQRHIQEYGPLSVAVLMTDEFRTWDYSQKPVYTGGSHVLGGHVMLVLGWGNIGGVDFWQVRNSWGPRWANGGYCKFQRGVNLDAIEERGVAASMPTSDFPDWTLPVCDLRGIRWQWWKLNDGTVTNYTGFLDVGCDKDCSLDVFFSERSEDADHAEDSGMRKRMPATAHGLTTFTLNLLTLGFGTEAGAMVVGLKAADARGNEAETHASLRIPAAGF